MKDMIEAVKAHAIENYERYRWDVIAECYTDSELEELLLELGAQSPEDAIRKVDQVAKNDYEYTQEIQSTIF